MYTKLIKDELLEAKEDTIFIEGGSLFYLNLFISEFQNPTNQVIEDFDTYLDQASQILKPYNNWDDQLQVLKKHCESFDTESNEISKNDVYRLTKALAYALVTKGKSYKRKNAKLERDQ